MTDAAVLRAVARMTPSQVERMVRQGFEHFGESFQVRKVEFRGGCRVTLASADGKEKWVVAV